MSETSKPSVRQVSRTDAAEISRLLSQLGYPADADAVQKHLDTLLRRPDHFVVVLDGSDGIAGFLHAERRHSVANGERAEVVALVVDIGVRRGGIGRALVRAAEDWATKHDLSLLTVRSNVVRRESHPFYKRLGYKRSKTQHFYGKALGSGRSNAS